MTDEPTKSGDDYSIIRRHILRSKNDRRRRDYERRTSVYMLPWWKRMIRKFARRVLQ
jgi:hypothetical protein